MNTSMRGPQNHGGGVIDPASARMVRLFRYVKNKKIYVSNVIIDFDSGCPREASFSVKLKESSLMSQALAERTIKHVPEVGKFKMELFAR